MSLRLCGNGGENPGREPRELPASGAGTHPCSFLTLPEVNLYIGEKSAIGKGEVIDLAVVRGAIQLVEGNGAGGGCFFGEFVFDRRSESEKGLHPRLSRGRFPDCSPLRDPTGGDSGLRINIANIV